MPDTISIPEDTTVFHQGEEGDFFYIIIKGEVEVFKRVATGEVSQLRVLERGGHFGEIALIRDIPRTASVRTLSPCEFVTFPRDEFLKLLDNNPSLRTALEHELIFLLGNSDNQDSGEASENADGAATP